MKALYAIALLTIIIIVSGCASSGSPTVRGQEIRIRYAEVTAVERVTMPSAAPAGAILGGFTGLVLSSGRSPGRQVASGIGGAALGGLATRALEGDRQGYGYTLDFVNGDSSRFITEKSYLQVGDCVSVERGQYANIRRVAPTLCKDSLANYKVDPTHARDAAQCHEAKDKLLAASSEADIAAAARKVEIICAY